jgi:hypothetical protein
VIGGGTKLGRCSNRYLDRHVEIILMVVDFLHSLSNGQESTLSTETVIFIVERSCVLRLPIYS